jgi:hypothetical protein
MWTKNATMTGDGSLKRLHLRELKRLPRCVTEKATLTWTEKVVMTEDESLKRLPWRQLKRLQWHYRLCFTKLQMKLLSDSSGYKRTLWGRELRCIQTHRPHIIGSKEPVPWSPRWMRQKLREENNGLPPIDLNHDEKPPADAERPLYKCDLDCQSHMSIDYDTYCMRYWSCPQPTYLFY